MNSPHPHPPYEVDVTPLAPVQGRTSGAWPDSLCQALVAGGYRVVRFDNRDCGLSARAPAHGRVDLLHTSTTSVLKLPVPSPYTLHDMALDTLGVMDALQIQQAHIVGLSMGGLIGQVLAATQARLQQPALLPQLAHRNNISASSPYIH